MLCPVVLWYAMLTGLQASAHIKEAMEELDDEAEDEDAEM